MLINGVRSHKEEAKNKTLGHHTHPVHLHFLHIFLFLSNLIQEQTDYPCLSFTIQQMKRNEGNGPQTYIGMRSQMGIFRETAGKKY